MGAKTWISDGILLDKPNVARAYDYLVGGYHNFEADRLMAEKVISIYPDSRLCARACRAFLCRVVNFLAEQGLDQFLDIGSGIPTTSNVHEVAQAVNPAARTVYVDIDSVAIAHSRAILKDNPNAVAIQADARQPDQILNHAEVKRLLDFGQPAAVLFLTLLHYIVDDDQARSVVRTLRDALAAGSYIAISHGTRDNAPPEVIEQMEKLTASSTIPNKYRSWAQIQQLFDGLELVEPGLVYIPLWRPERPDEIFLDQPERTLVFGGVGRKL